MAKQINNIIVTFTGDGETLDKATINYCVRDTVDTELTKNAEIVETDDPSSVTWADAVARVKTAEGIS